MKTKRPPGRPRVEVKPHQFSVRLHAEDLAALEELATFYGTSLSGAVELCVRAQIKRVPVKARRAMAELRKAREEAPD